MAYCTFEPSSFRNREDPLSSSSCIFLYLLISSCIFSVKRNHFWRSYNGSIRSWWASFLSELAFEIPLQLCCQAELAGSGSQNPFWSLAVSALKGTGEVFSTVGILFHSSGKCCGTSEHIRNPLQMFAMCCVVCCLLGTYLWASSHELLCYVINLPKFTVVMKSIKCLHSRRHL